MANSGYISQEFHIATLLKVSTTLSWTQTIKDKCENIDLLLFSSTNISWKHWFIFFILQKFRVFSFSTKCTYSKDPNKSAYASIYFEKKVLPIPAYLRPMRLKKNEILQKILIFYLNLLILCLKFLKYFVPTLQFGPTLLIIFQN